MEQPIDQQFQARFVAIEPFPLQEQKQVIIHQAVTRGLDPNVKRRLGVGTAALGDGYNA